MTQRLARPHSGGVSRLVRPTTLAPVPDALTPGERTWSERARPAVPSSPQPPRARRAGHGAALAATGITVQLGDLTANRDVTLEVAEGMVTALIGPNGAGKTTFFNVLTGGVRPTSGRISVFGADVGELTPARACRLGLIRTFQNLKVLPRLSVADNVAIGASRLVRAGLATTLAGLPPARRARAVIAERVEWALDFVGVGAPADALVADLPYGIDRLVEIARALAAQPRLLLLDEPTAGMGPGETLEIGALISRIVDELAIPVFVVEHDMRVVRRFADTVNVLERGALIASGPPDVVLSDQRVIDVYLGTKEHSMTGPGHV